MRDTRIIQDRYYVHIDMITKAVEYGDDWNGGIGDFRSVV